MLVYKVVVGELYTNCYLAVDEKTSQTLIIDPGDNADKIINRILDHKLKPVAIINTHAHPDHMLANYEVKQKFSIPVYAHEKDKIMFKSGALFFGSMGYSAKISPDHYIKDGQVFDFGESSLKVLHTPGHSPGGICLYDGDKILFSGDTLFKDGVGRVDLPGGSLSALSNSIKDKIFKLPKDTVVYPGHGMQTTIYAEEMNVARELL
ncbi:MAG: MBL fold metallo-hydrolase [Candidatus Margulisbacteria bacterium]|nr:MBL fold metallo-hydrolase [Candidatus Margulisiibacteriota bacterium]MBU1021678.1 MBL fold metallo-hydrolase [Candidatus Margulisiibacteriota bacterium]MBU1729556.1 MBL fold metallo-hydrolase [Candidatus Margulisiibacteriota bacterium]MBU1955042.1 MBL fold metallo-hydrolase [Candidatus Margulisiibacteriota bacterium]